MYLNISIMFTLIRVAMVPCFIIAFYLPLFCNSFLCSLFFFIASITDWFDGFIARKWHQITNFGAFLDPVADKIIITMALVLIIEYFHIWWITLPSAGIIAREIIILALRGWFIKLDLFEKLSVSWIAKTKTFVQMFSLTILLYRPDCWIMKIGILSLYIALLLAFWSMFQYLNTILYNVYKLN